MTLGLAFVVTLVAFEALAVATVMPAVEEALGGIGLYGWTFSAFFLTSLLGITVAGRWCDEFGPARPFAAGLVLFGCGLLVAGLAPSMAVVVVGRAVQGIGGGALPAIAYVAIGRGYEESLRPRMFAIVSSAWVIPGLVGPAVSGAVADLWSWRLVFVGLLPLLVAAAILALPPLARLGPPAEQYQRPASLMQAAALALGAGMVLAALTGVPLPVAVPLALAGIALAWWALGDLFPEGTLRAAPGLPAAVVGAGLLVLAFLGTEAFVPFMLTRLRDQATWTAGLVLTTATLSWTSGAWLQERTASRLRRSLVLRAGLVLVAVGISSLTLVLVPGVPWPLAAASWAITGLGMGLSFQSFSLIVLDNAPAGGEGASAAALTMAQSLGAALGAGFAGAIVSAGSAADREPQALAIAFLVMALAAVTGLALAGRAAASTTAIAA
jgi:MFS family permease